MANTQPRDALRLATRIRVHAAHVRRQLKAGEVSFPDVLLDPVLANYPLGRVMTWLPRVRDARARLFCNEAGIPQSFLALPLSRLTQRQRDELGYTVWLRCAR